MILPGEKYQIEYHRWKKNRPGNETEAPLKCMLIKELVREP
jgi:hypothetical protein